MAGDLFYMPTIRKKTIVLNRLLDSKTRKPLVIKKPKNVSDTRLRSIRREARSTGRSFRKALAAA